MTTPFHKRFDIEIPIDEARRRFVNRMREFTELVIDSCQERPRSEVMQVIKIKLGEKQGFFRNESAYEFMSHWDDFVKEDFWNCLRITEEMYYALIVLERKAASTFNKQVERAFGLTENDLEISWDAGVFIRKGAALLDERLVNDPLHWLRENSKYRNVLDPFEKGLKHLSEGNKAPERYSDVITDMYEALEGMAKTVTGRKTKDLSANKEMFISTLKLPDAYKPLLDDYIKLANNYRHALESGKKRVPSSGKDTEAFVYLTGLFIRLESRYQ